MSFESFERALVGADGRLLLTAREEAPWLHDTLSIDGLVLQVAQEGGPNSYEGAASDGVVTLLVGLPAPESLCVTGADLRPGLMSIVRPGEPVISCTQGVNRWAGLTMPIERFIETADLIDDAQTNRLLRGSPNIHIATAAGKKIEALVDRITRAAENTGFEHPTAARAASEELVSAFVGAAARAGTDETPSGRPPKPRAQIIERALAHLEHTGGAYCSIAELAQCAEVSAVTLRRVFVDYLGATPKRLLMLRQIHAVRHDLLRASSEGTVTGVAATHGVWDLGRFAHRYKSLFGELPSETLGSARGCDGALIGV